MQQKKTNCLAKIRGVCVTNSCSDNLVGLTKGVNLFSPLDVDSI
jgi:hypothetical protein